MKVWSNWLRNYFNIVVKREHKRSRWILLVRTPLFGIGLYRNARVSYCVYPQSGVWFGVVPNSPPAPNSWKRMRAYYRYNWPGLGF